MNPKSLSENPLTLRQLASLVYLFRVHGGRPFLDFEGFRIGSKYMRFSASRLLPISLIVLSASCGSSETSVHPAPSQLQAQSKPQNLANDCNYYIKFEDNVLSCKRSGYPLGFGLKYCKKFSALNDGDLSATGIVWRNRVRTCLIEAMQSLEPEFTGGPSGLCRSVKIKAFDSHPMCYTEGAPSFCELPPQDVLRIIGVVEPQDIFAPLATVQNVRIVERCIRYWQQASHHTRTYRNAQIEFWKSL